MSDLLIPVIKNQEISNRKCSIVKSTYKVEESAENLKDPLEISGEQSVFPDENYWFEDFQNGDQQNIEVENLLQEIDDSRSKIGSNGLKVSFLGQTYYYCCVECGLKLKCKYMIHNFHQKISYICNDKCMHSFCKKHDVSKFAILNEKSDPKTLSNLAFLTDNLGLKNITNVALLKESSGPKIISNLPLLNENLAPKIVSTMSILNQNVDAPIFPSSILSNENVCPNIISTLSLSDAGLGSKIVSTLSLINESSGPKTVSIFSQFNKNFGAETHTNFSEINEISGSKVLSNLTYNDDNSGPSSVLLKKNLDTKNFSNSDPLKSGPKNNTNLQPVTNSSSLNINSNFFINDNIDSKSISNFPHLKFLPNFSNSNENSGPKTLSNFSLFSENYGSKATSSVDHLNFNFNEKFDTRTLSNLTLLNEISSPKVQSNLIPLNQNSASKGPENTSLIVDSNKKSIRKCIECFRALIDPRFNFDAISWENLEFCDEECLEEYQRLNCSICWQCKIEISKNNYGKFSVKVSQDFKHFCSTKCQNDFKTRSNLCFLCYENLNFSTKFFTGNPDGKFCSTACLEKFEQISNTVNKNVYKEGICTYCKKNTTLFITFENCDVIFKFCTKTCFDTYTYLNKITPLRCSNCQNFFFYDYHRKMVCNDSMYNHFCSNICKDIYFSEYKLILQCSWCKSVKYHFSMIKKNINSKQVAACSQRCLKLYQKTLAIFEISKRECRLCLNNANNKFHVTMWDNTVYSFCSRICVDNYLKKLGQNQISTTRTLEKTDFQTILPKTSQSSSNVTSNAQSQPSQSLVPVISKVSTPQNLHQRNLTSQTFKSTNFTPRPSQQSNFTFQTSQQTTSVPRISQQTNFTSQIPIQTLTPQYFQQTNFVLQTIQQTNLVPQSFNQSTITSQNVQQSNIVSQINQQTNLSSQQPDTVSLAPQYLLSASCTPQQSNNTPKTSQQLDLIPETKQQPNDFSQTTQQNNIASQSIQQTNFSPQYNHDINELQGSLLQKSVENKNVQTFPVPPKILREILVCSRKHAKMINKMTNCRPFQLNFTQNTVDLIEKVDESTQTGDLPEVLIPIPFPFYVPTPVLFGEKHIPIPFPVPVPIPVPIFLPMKQKSNQDILKEIAKIQKTIPANPLEAELVRMAALYEEKQEEEEKVEKSNEEAIEVPKIDLELPHEGSISSDSDEDLPLSKRIGRWKNEIKILKIEKVSKDGLETTFDTFGEKRKLGKDLERNLTKSSINKEIIPKRSKRLKKNSEETTKESNSEEKINTTSLIVNYGINAWYFWFQEKYKNTPFGTKNILDLRPEELNNCLSDFVEQIRKPSGQEYFPDTIFYLCLCIQKYLVDNGKKDNIFLDDFYEKFIKTFDKISMKFALLHEPSSFVITRVEEQYLWESNQLGTFSPKVLLCTLIYHNTINFALNTIDKHKELSFGRMIKCTKNKNATLLRYYPPYVDKKFEKKYFEIGQLEDSNKCPIKIFDFYISKCPDYMRRSSTLLYLIPEKYCTEESPVWFSSQPLSDTDLEIILRRIGMVKEVNMVSS